MRKIRLFVPQKTIQIGQSVELRYNDYDYLVKVLRQKTDDEIHIFNGLDGEFRSKITHIEKKHLHIEVLEKTADLQPGPNLTLAFSLIKNVKNDFIATKATELGITTFQPIITRRTIVDKINRDKFSINIKEACEQCERNDVPRILDVQKLHQFLSQHDISDKIIILCDESGQGASARKLLPKLTIAKNQEVVILIGPEGGFSSDEFDTMRHLPNVHSLSLGPRILRADTAIVVAIALVKEFLE